MELVSNLTKSSVQNWQGNLTTEKPSYETASQDEKDSYLDQLYLIVADSFRLSSQNPTDEEKALRADSWCRVLMGVVPEGDLERSFRKAFEVHTSNFPVSAYDLKSGYEKLIEEERAAKEARHRELLREADERHRHTERFECKSCFNCGFREVPDPQGSNYRGRVKCDRCEYWNSWA